MSSPHVTHLLTDYLDGTLPTPLMERVKSHLVFCNACRQIFQGTKENIVILKSTPLIPPSKELEKRILNQLSDSTADLAPASTPPTLSRHPWLFSFRGMSFAAAALVLMFLMINLPQMVKDTKKLSPQPAKLLTPQEKKKTDAAHEAGTHGLAPDGGTTTPERKFNMMAPLQIEHDEEKPSVVNENVQKTELSEARKDRLASDLRQKSTVAAGKAASAISEVSSVKKPDETKELSKNNENELFSGFFSGITRPLEKVVSDQKTWEEIWNRHRKPYSEPQSAPMVDFENNEIIALFSGSQPSGGYKIEITRILQTRWEDAPARVVRYQIITPSTNAMVTMSLSQPFLFKVVPKTEGPTFFKKIR